uniref:ATP synthase F0 subunit 8 n=1 Tax=Aeolothrips indicus TaxID=2856552 RepID=A0A8F5J8D3_9NEOP|nr:ATP synthase F0 subunit 8 [Aeolothrips indicus]
MPQMDALLWTRLFIYFIVVFYFYLSIIYFTHKISKKEKKTYKSGENLSMYWKKCL